ncbi:class I SAM-dependent methyltransferase [Phycicoccus flavus]|uniref:Class I SAM-dependent methyltransferase n=1 Tax=Phycicoccus flavus TaxID=2502783 RepID=A0A8T6R187_9MICO|nr:class I SAM-dependent methyltransferase [Phycicoccus flavus]NHA67502.1 class I SAM-dependent methyltransferase [Phycicoccus flavus]
MTTAQLESIVGAFHEPDIAAFRALLARTAAELPGDLAELGAFYGRSAVLIGSSLGAGETFTVVDLFGQEADDASNAAENADSYPGLTQAAFEDNYRRVHGTLPVVVRGFSQTVVEHVPPGTHRFVHVDASHLYEHVVQDIEAAHRILQDDGVLVLDDIRSEHTPGVAAAAWQAVLRDGLRPFAISPFKLYATFGDPARWQPALQELADTGVVRSEVQRVNDLDLLRFWSLPRPEPVLPWRRYVPEVAWPAVSRVGGAALKAGRRR